MKSTLRRFLSLEFWSVDVSYDLNTWKPIFQSRSPAFLNKIISELGDILHTVKTPLFSRDQKGQLVLLVHPEFEKQAQEIADRNHTKIEQLYDRAENLAETENSEQELRIYDILSELVPDNPAVHYNRGNILIALDRLDEATESLIEATVLGLPEIVDKVDLKPHRGSGVAGSVNPSVKFPGIVPKKIMNRCSIPTILMMSKYCYNTFENSVRKIPEFYTDWPSLPNKKTTSRQPVSTTAICSPLILKTKPPKPTLPIWNKYSELSS